MRRFRSYLLAFSVSFAALPAAADNVDVSEQARERFRLGVAYMTDPDGAQYEEAYREFKAAYSDSPSWKILGNLGIAAMKLERDGEAIWAFENYLKDGGDQIDPAERAQMERDLSTLRAGVAQLELSSVPEGATFVDERIPISGRPILNRYPSGDQPLSIGVRRGRHRITAKLAGYEDAVWEVEVEPGHQHQYLFEMQRPTTSEPAAHESSPGTVSDGAPPVMERPIPLPVYITAGATGALLVGAGVTGFLAMQKKSDFEDINDGSDPAAATDLRDSGRTFNLVTDVLLGGAIAAGAVTAVLYFSRPEVPAQRDTARLTVTPAVGPRAGGLSVSGAF